MKVLDMMNKIKNLETLKTSVLVINDDHRDVLDTEDIVTLEDVAEAIDEYIIALMHKEVKV
jgi:hypothetical protein